MLIFINGIGYGQSEDFLGEFEALIDNENVQLIPDKMIFTQKLFWGEKGLLRKARISKLTIENREKELILREKMFSLTKPKTIYGEFNNNTTKVFVLDSNTLLILPHEILYATNRFHFQKRIMVRILRIHSWNNIKIFYLQEIHRKSPRITKKSTRSFKKT